MKMPVSYKFTPILGWSASRYETFSNCKRAYYYTYYGKFDNQIPLDEINYLKKLTSIPLETGNIIHDVIRDALVRYTKTTAPIDKNKLFAHIYTMVKSYCNNKVFSEVYYKTLDKVDLEVIYTAVKTAVVNFFNSNRLEWIIQEAIDNKNDWIIEPGGYGETRFGDLKAYCKVDFLFPHNNEYYILDWKSGRYSATKHRKQMLAYSVWAKMTFALEPEQINPILTFLLPEYREIGEPFTATEMAEFYPTLESETQEMYAYCAGVQDNVPIPKENFPQTTNYFVCSFCNFRKLCNLSQL